MASLGDLFWELRARDTNLAADATKSGQKAGAAAGKGFSDRIRSSMADFQKSGGIQNALLGGVGVGVGLSAFGLISKGIGQVTDFMSDSITKAKEEQAGIERLNTSLKANVEGYNGNRDAIEAVISEREKLAFSDGEQRDSLALLVASTHDVTQALDLQREAMDLARLRSISLADASTIITKVFNGNIGILKRYGIQVAKGASVTEALAGIQRQAAGQAEAYGKTTEGRIESVRIAIDDFQETIGGVFIDAAKSAIDTLSALGSAFHDLQRLMNPTQKATEDLKDQLGKLAASEGMDPDVVKAYADQVIRLDQAQADAAQRAANNEQLVENFRQAQIDLKVSGDDLTKSVDDYRKALAGTLVVQDQSTGALTEQEVATQKAQDALSRYLSVQDLATRSGVSFDTMMGEIAKQAQDTGTTFELALGAVGKAINEGTWLPNTMEAALNMAQTYLDSLKGAVEHVAPQVAQVVSVPFAKAFADVAPSVVASFKSIPSKIKGHLDKIKIVFSTALKDTRDEIKLRMAEIQDALEHPFRGQRLEKTYREGMTKAVKAMAKAQKAGNVEAYALAKAEYEYLKGKVDAIDALKATVKVGWKIDAAVPALKAALHKVKLTLPDGSTISAFHFLQGKAVGKASGGAVQRGMPYVVGERRPELFVPKTDGTILPSVPGMNGRVRHDFYVHDQDGGLARAGISTSELANALRRWEDA